MYGDREMVIDFAPTGEVSAMHRENILDLGFLGPQRIERATDIRFDETAQKWAIWPSDGAGGFIEPREEAKGFDSYEQARKIEVSWMETCRLVGVSPDTNSGYLILGHVVRVTP